MSRRSRVFDDEPSSAAIEPQPVDTASKPRQPLPEPQDQPGTLWENLRARVRDYDRRMSKRHRTIQMRVSPETLAKISEWRRHQQDLPSRAEAIRRLITKALADEFRD